jgi:predicted phosphodiesterase
MPTPRMTDETCIERYAVYLRHHKSRKLAAEELGIATSTLDLSIEHYKARGLNLPDGVKDSMTRAGLDPAVIRGGHRRVYDDDGKQIDTVRYTVAQDVHSESLLDNIAAAFENITSVAVAPPVSIDGDHMTVYPLYDMHIGMMAWGRETRGQDFDLNLMKSDLLQSIAKVMKRSPDSSEALIILGGDTIHVNDHFNETPASRHHQDTDGRYEKVIDVAIEAISAAIEMVAQKHASVKVVVLRGNHDETSHVVLKASLKQRYRDTDHINFPVMNGMDKSEIFWMAFGDVLVVAHHGDKAKPEKLALIAADKCPDWSGKTCRIILTGHIHTFKVMDMPGVTHYSLRAFCPPDAYGANFGGVRGISAMTFDKTDGLVVSAHDPIHRK